MEVRNMFNVTLSSAAQARQFESSYSLNKGTLFTRLLSGLTFFFSQFG